MKNDKGKRIPYEYSVNLIELSLTALRIRNTLEKVIPFGILLDKLFSYILEILFSHRIFKFDRKLFNFDWE